MFADLLGDVRDPAGFWPAPRPSLEQEREPASRPRPRHRPRARRGRGTSRAARRVNERLVLEEVQMPPHALPRVMHPGRGLAAPRFRAGETANPPRTRSRYAVPVCPSSVTELHPDTLHGSGSCRAAVNNDVWIRIPPNYPTSTTTPRPTHSTPNSERPYVLIMVSHSRVEHLLLISESSTPQPQNSAKELSSVGSHAPLGKYPSDNTAGRSNVEVKLSG